MASVFPFLCDDVKIVPPLAQRRELWLWNHDMEIWAWFGWLLVM